MFIRLSPLRPAARVLASLLVAAGSILAALPAAAQQQGPAAPPVKVARPLVQEIVEWDEYTGRFEADERVEIRARVSGYLQSVHFEDGQFVEKDQLLFVIDPRPYEAAVSRARAALTRARSQLTVAELDLRRGEALLPKAAITAEQVDTRRANQQVAQADVSAAEAELRQAELDLAYTQVTAPISGRVSSALVDVGNLVVGDGGQSTQLTSIVSMDPINFVFDVSESEYLKYARLSGGSGAGLQDAGRTAEVRLLDETSWGRQGRIDFVNNVFDQATGTIRMRARFDNPQGLLLPGVFGRLRLAATGPHEAIMIPEAAVVSDQANKLVMLVGEDNTIQPRPIELGPLRGDLRVVRSGLGPDDRLVVSGLLRARPGAQVTPEEVEITPQQPEGAPAGGEEGGAAGAASPQAAEAGSESAGANRGVTSEANAAEPAGRQ